MQISIILNFVAIIFLFIAIWVMVGMLWRSITNFFHKNYSFFDISFVLAYFIEQFLLILLLFFKPQYADVWVASFALLVITTASIQKIAMDSRDRKIRELYTTYKSLVGYFLDFIDRLKKENESLSEANKKLSSLINNSKKKR